MNPYFSKRLKEELNLDDSTSITMTAWLPDKDFLCSTLKINNIPFVIRRSMKSNIQSLKQHIELADELIASIVSIYRESNVVE